MEHPQQGKIVPLQALRLVAALLVLIGHGELFGYHLGRFLGMELPKSLFLERGGFGVDLFFVISGFVMVYSSRRLYGAAGGKRTFLIRRLARIVPLYWLATLVTLAWSLRFGPDLPTPGALADSFLFIPYRNPSGRVAPLLEVGWTLNYEMLFYLTFGLALAASARATVQRVAMALAALVLLRLLVAPPLLPLPLAAWTRPILLEFAAGQGLALLYLRGVTLPPAPRLALAVVGIALFAKGDFGSGVDFVGWLRVGTFGMAGLCLLAATMLGPLALPGARFWVLGGDMSYALYLCHMPIQNAAQFVWRHYKWRYGPWQELGFVVGTTAAALVAGLIVHVWLERPLTAWLNARLLHRRLRDDRLQVSGV